MEGWGGGVGGGYRTVKCRIHNNQHCQKANLLVQYYNGSQLCHVHLGELNAGYVTVVLPAYHQCKTLTPHPHLPTTTTTKK